MIGESAGHCARVYNAEMESWFLMTFAALSMTGCRQLNARLNEATGKTTTPETAPVQAPSKDVNRVMIVINKNSLTSQEVGAYYRSMRSIPTANVVFIECPDSEELPKDQYESKIEQPIKTALKASKNMIDFIVTTKGVPIRIAEGGFSVDAFLAAMNLTVTPIAKLEEADIRRCTNPYFTKTEPFSAAKFNMYLVTRLDGYTVADCKKLVDSSLAAKPEKGRFFFDEADNRKDPAYKPMQDTLSQAYEELKKQGYESELDQTGTFVAPSGPLMGYASWGSNDGAFDNVAYKKIRFLPGALAETFVSTSGRTFNPTTGGQSLIADLIASGVTGVKGYVSEPYTFALARPELLFPRYVSGRNLAESFYSASMVIKWKDVVIGDPLCSPYAQ